MGIRSVHFASDQKVSQEVVLALLQETLGDFKCDLAGGPKLRGKIVHEHGPPVFRLKSGMRGKIGHSLRSSGHEFRRI